MRPDPISPSFAEQIDTPKVVGSRNEAASPTASPVHRPATADRHRRRVFLADRAHTGRCLSVIRGRAARADEQLTRRSELTAALNKVFVDTPKGVDDLCQGTRQVSDRLTELIGRTGVPVGAGESGEVIDELPAVAHVGRHADSAQFGEHVISFAHGTSLSVGRPARATSAPA